MGSSTWKQSRTGRHGPSSACPCHAEWTAGEEGGDAGFDALLIAAGFDETVSPPTDEGADAIKHKLAELHETLMGVRVSVALEDVQAAWGLFQDVWNRLGRVPHRRFPSDRQGAWTKDIRYFDGILDDATGIRTHTYTDQNGEERETRTYGFDHDLVNAFLHQEVAPMDTEGTARPGWSCSPS